MVAEWIPSEHHAVKVIDSDTEETSHIVKRLI